MSHPLQDEISAFEGMLPRLRKEHGSVWAVVHKGALAAAFSEFEAAARFADQTFMNEPVLIRHTNQHTPHIPFIAIEA